MLRPPTSAASNGPWTRHNLGVELSKSRFRVLALAVTALAASLNTTHAGAASNATNAKMCQKLGWQNVQTSEQVRFANQDECVSYAARGGQLEPVPVPPVLIVGNMAADGSYRTGSSNFVESYPYGNPPGDHDVATRFTVPAGGTAYRLSSLRMPFETTVSGPLDVFLVGEMPCDVTIHRCDSETTVGPDLSNVLETWRLSGATGQDMNFASGSRPLLAAGQSYWIVASIPEDAVAQWRWWSGSIPSIGWAKAERYDCCFSYLWVTHVATSDSRPDVGPGYQVFASALL